MKKNIKIVALVYVGLALFTYALTLRTDRLERSGDLRNHNQSLVLELR